MLTCQEHYEAVGSDIRLNIVSECLVYFAHIYTQNNMLSLDEAGLHILHRLY